MEQSFIDNPVKSQAHENDCLTFPHEKKLNLLKSAIERSTLIL